MKLRLLNGAHTSLAVLGLAKGLTTVAEAVADPDLRRRRAETARAIDEVRGVQSVRIHPLGSDVRVDLEISVDGGLTVTAGHDIAHRVEDALREAEATVRDVHVHVNPCLPDGLHDPNLFQAHTPPDPLP